MSNLLKFIPRLLAVIFAAQPSLAVTNKALAMNSVAPPPVVTVIKAGQLIDGSGRTPLTPAMVRVEGDRITAVASQLEVPEGALLIDLGTATLLPGLIDLHAHLTYDPSVHWQDTLLKMTPSQATLWGAHNALVTLRAGFTTCRDMGPTWPYTDIELRNAIEQGLVPGPRIYAAGSYVTSTGGAGDGSQYSMHVDVPNVRNLADGPDEIVKLVRTNLKNGADFIKILATGAVLSDGISPGAQQYSDEEIFAAVTEAQRWGRRVASHAHGTGGIKASIRAGVWTIDHSSMLDEEAIALLKATRKKDALAYGTYYVPTLYIMNSIATDGIIPESQKERARQVREQSFASFRMALAAGLPIGVGSDVPVMPYGENAKELTMRVSLGESPMAAIVSATRVNAEILGLSASIGTVEGGKLADVIAVATNPLDDIRALEQVGFVMKGGAIYKNEFIRR